MAGFDARFFFGRLVYLPRDFAIYLLSLFGFISSYIFRLQGGICGSIFDSNDDGKVGFVEAEEHHAEFRNVADGTDEEENPDMLLRFKFPTYEEFRHQFQKGAGTLLDSEVIESGKILIGNELERFPFEESDEIDSLGVRSDNEGEGFSGSTETGEVGKGELALDEVEIEKIELLKKSDENEQTVVEKQEFDYEHHFLSENHSMSFGSDSDSESTSYSVINHLLNSYRDDFLLDKDFGEEPDVNGEDAKTESWSESDETQGFPEDFGSEDSGLAEGLNDHNPDGSNSDSLSEEDFNENSNNINDAEGGAPAADTTMDGSEKPESDDNELESLWEHQELMEQLKMELRKVRGAGLPTILEESEPSAKILMDDLKPWKIDEFQREDCIGELQKFYKSYRERMRKFDIVSYQKMYAIGCLQLKDPLQTMSRHNKPSSPMLKSLLAANLQMFKNKTRIHGSDPMKKFIKELQDDLEVVYVAHMSLSWEFLYWQYEKALDLWDSHPHAARRYNEVADEFQQFQVLMQRFIEDERFHGPRVQNYVQSRRVLRNLLQVPVIRADNLKGKRKGTDEYAITSEMLVEILEESIRIFWRFLRADKDCTAAAVNGTKKMPELACPEDAELLMEARKILQKKERKLKDLLRSQHCILRKFRQRREDGVSDQVLCFFSQVDMKLVCRALNMAKITKEQLVWCHNKLHRISFENRKLHVEPGFLLFPC